MGLPIIRPTRKTGNVGFNDGRAQLGPNLKEYWQWAISDSGSSPIGLVARRQVGLALLSRVRAVSSGSFRKKGSSLTPTTPPSDRRFTDKVYPLATLIGPGACVRGDVRSDHPVEIRGTLEGDCHTSARCIVHEGGRVLGNIDAIAIVVAGEVDAGLLKAEKVELRASAHVLGVIWAGVVVIADGAFYKGEIENPGAAGGPPVLKDRRRSERG